MYLIFSLRTSAWLAPTGNYTSDRAKAMRLPRDEALAVCESHKLSGKLTTIPVREEDLNDLG